MSRLPSVSGQQVVAALQRIGFGIRRQHGSHIIMRRDEPFSQTVVPAHREFYFLPVPDGPLTFCLDRSLGTGKGDRALGTILEPGD